MNNPLLNTSELSKTFGGTLALDRVSLRAEAGEIVGLIGRNGSGKSTLVKLLSGYHAPDGEGWIELSGRRYSLPVPPERARRGGLSFVHQDLGLLADASILENLRIGRFDTGFAGRIRWRHERMKVEQALSDFELAYSVDTKIGQLSQVDQALIALIRSFLDLESAGDGGVLVLDEPTAYLARDDVNRLFAGARQVAANGASVIFVSHRLDEVLELTHRVVVLRDGSIAAEFSTADASESQLVEAILGRPMGDYYPDAGARVRTKETLLVLDNLNGESVKDVSIQASAGEIVGLTGLRGMGHDEVPYLIFGASRAKGGRIELSIISLDATLVAPRRMIKLGVGFLPADRKNTSGAQDFSVRENLTMPVLQRFFKMGLLRHRAEKLLSRAVATEFGIMPAEPELPLHTLSGGNQQKVLLAKWLQIKPRLMLFHEPTAGVDVGAKKELFVRLVELARTGTCVIIASEEIEDLAHLCDRVYVFVDGRVAGPPLEGSELTEARILERCYVGVGNHEGSSPLGGVAPG